MKELFWWALAQILAKPRIAEWIIRRAQRTPYMHILSPDGRTTYMWRWWLLNPYNRKTQKPRWSCLPFSVRVHHIARPDYDEHPHDHPWDARSIVLKGWYQELRLTEGAISSFMAPFIRVAGTTATLEHNAYHQIKEVGPSGAVTLFITWKYQGMWGFLVDGVKIPWRAYLGLREEQDLPDMAQATPQENPPVGTTHHCPSSMRRSIWRRESGDVWYEWSGKAWEPLTEPEIEAYYPMVRV